MDSTIDVSLTTLISALGVMKSPVCMSTSTIPQILEEMYSLCGSRNHALLHPVFNAMVECFYTAHMVGVVCCLRYDIICVVCCTIGVH